jgi:hypothetical protein
MPANRNETTPGDADVSVSCVSTAGSGGVSSSDVSTRFFTALFIELLIV